MLKTGLKIFIFVVALTGLVLGYYYFFERNKNVPDTLQVFANNGAMLRVNNPVAFFDGLDNVGFFDQFNVSDSILFQNLRNLEKIEQNNCVAHFFLGFETTDTLISPFIVLESYNYRHAQETMDYLKSEAFDVNNMVRKEKNELNYYAVYPESEPKLFFAEVNGLIIMCFDQQVLINQAKQIKDYKRSGEKSKLVKIANADVVANLFINSSKFHHPIIRKETENQAVHNQYIVLDVYLKKDKWILSGLAQVSNAGLGNVLAKASSRNFNLPEILPEDVSIFYEMAAAQLLDTLKELAQLEAEIFSWLKEWESNKIVHFKTPKGYGVAFKAKGPSVAKNALDNYRKKFETNATINRYQFDKETSFDIYKGNFNWAEEILPFRFTSELNLKYASAVGGYIVLAPDNQTIRSICRNTVLQQNLKSSYRFQQYEPYLSSASNFMGYAKFKSENLTPYFNSEIIKTMKKAGLFELFQVMALQTTGSGQHLYNHIVLFSKTQEAQGGNVRWKTKLNSSASMKPAVVRNHINSSDEILVQDASDFIYLINKKGRVLWKKQLDGQLLSDVYQVDKYKNSKLQYLFNTKSKIYLVDRNGNDVERFPVKLSENASAGLSVFDYEKKRQYRIFIPLRDKTVRLYDIDANIVSGWDFEKADGLVRTPVQHFRFSGKDYIVFADSIRYYILNRRGRHRIRPDKLIGKSKNNPIFFDTRKARWVSTSPTGELIYINVAGNVETKKIETFSNNHHFLFTDLTRDGKKDYVFVDKKKLTVFNYRSKKLFTHEFPHEITEPPAIYNFSRHKAGLGIVDKEAGKVYMFNRDGKQFKGYPFPGITPFTISHIRGYPGFQLIVGNYDGFLYDYQLQ